MTHKKTISNNSAIHFLKLVIPITLVFFLTACKKDNQSFDCYFFTDYTQTPALLTLYIDDKYNGELPNLKTRLSPDNDTLIKNALHVKLKIGKYKIIGKDKQGNIKTECTLKLKGKSTKSTSSKGGLALSSNDQAIVMSLFF